MSPALFRTVAVGASLVLAAPLACSAAGAPADSDRRAPSVPPEPSRTTTPHVPAARAADGRFPALRVGVAARRLDIPWDVQQIPSGALLISERDRRRLLLKTKKGLRVLARRPRGIWSSGETGLMSIQVDPAFRRNGRFYTCHGASTNRGHDVRVVAWRMNDRRTSARRVDVLLSGIRATSGRHGGCRLELGRAGALYVGTGDATVASAPQSKRSLGGKVLRLNRMTGRPWPSNPWRKAANRHRRYVLTYGHRNVQGLAQRPGGPMWSVEHGPSRDDEVNRLVPRGNFGWDPGPGYDENVPMTDHSLPGRQVRPRWKSGAPTVATSGAAWVRGARWGKYRGTLAVAALKGSRVIFMKFGRHGKLLWTRAPARLTRYGRVRSITQGAGGALYVTTGNGGGADRVLRVRPSR